MCAAQREIDTGVVTCLYYAREMSDFPQNRSMAAFDRYGGGALATGVRGRVGGEMVGLLVGGSGSEVGSVTNCHYSFLSLVSRSAR